MVQKLSRPDDCERRMGLRYCGKGCRWGWAADGVGRPKGCESKRLHRLAFPPKKLRMDWRLAEEEVRGRRVWAPPLLSPCPSHEPSKKAAPFPTSTYARPAARHGSWREQPLRVKSSVGRARERCSRSRSMPFATITVLHNQRSSLRGHQHVCLAGLYCG